MRALTGEKARAEPKKVQPFEHSNLNWFEFPCLVDAFKEDFGREER